MDIVELSLYRFEDLVIKQLPNGELTADFTEGAQANREVLEYPILIPEIIYKLIKKIEPELSSPEIL